MFTYDFSLKLYKKIEKLAKKDPVLAGILHKKVVEIVSRDEKSIQMYKNLSSPMHQFKRIHLTDNYILLFSVNAQKMHIDFVDILHWDNAY
jgi:mRNA-degrading endonuclease RelE of RelBE toxin-antitoxin system